METEQLEEDLKWLGYLYSNYTNEFNTYITHQAEALGAGLCGFGKGWLEKGQVLYQSIGELCQEITTELTRSDTE